VTRPTRKSLVGLVVVLWLVCGGARAQTPADPLNDPCSDQNIVYGPAGSGCWTRPDLIAIPATEDRSWHLLQKQYDGLIRSVTHGLTKHECEFARARALGLPATPDEAAERERQRQKEEEDQKRIFAALEKKALERPECQAIADKNDILCKPSFMEEVVASSRSWNRRMEPTDIASAECFQ